jgi:hypothetical protein
MVERRPGINDISRLQGRVGDGVINRVIEIGGVPDNGPGKHSVPRALRQIERDHLLISSSRPGMQTKEDRRDWNLNHRLGR